MEDQIKKTPFAKEYEKLENEFEKELAEEAMAGESYGCVEKTESNQQ
jgi:hypothetical protein